MGDSDEPGLPLNMYCNTFYYVIIYDTKDWCLMFDATLAFFLLTCLLILTTREALLTILFMFWMATSLSMF